MSQALIILLAFVGTLLILVAYLYIARGDVFSHLVLLSVPICFLIVIRPLAFALIENFDGTYVPYAPSIEFYSILVVLINLLAYALLVAGYWIGVRGFGVQDARFERRPARGEDLLFGFGILGCGFLLWIVLMVRAGGLRTVILALADRADLFTLEGNYGVFMLAKTCVSVGALFLASEFFRAGLLRRAWLVTGAASFLLLTFGGRGAAVTVFLGGMIASHYLYKRVSTVTIGITATILLPILVVLGEVRSLLRGGDAPAFDRLGDLTHSASTVALKLSYVFRAFDYNVLFMVKNWEESLSYLGQYPLGLTALMPRSMYPDKLDLLGSRLADSIYQSVDYGVTPSMTVGVVLYWGWLSLPFLMTGIGYVAAKFWRFSTADAQPLKITVYALSWPVVPWLFYDLAGFLLSVVPLVVVLVPLYIVRQLGARSSSVDAREARS